MIIVKHNTPIQVNRIVYAFMIWHFRGIVAHRTEGGKYWIKALYPGYKKEIQTVLNQFLIKDNERTTQKTGNFSTGMSSNFKGYNGTS